MHRCQRGRPMIRSDSRFGSSDHAKDQASKTTSIASAIIQAAPMSAIPVLNCVISSSFIVQASVFVLQRSTHRQFSMRCHRISQPWFRSDYRPTPSGELWGLPHRRKYSCWQYATSFGVVSGRRWARLPCLRGRTAVPVGERQSCSPRTNCTIRESSATSVMRRALPSRSMRPARASAFSSRVTASRWARGRRRMSRS